MATDTQQTLTKPTRKLIQFFHWLKISTKFAPDICIDVCPGTGTPAMYSAFSDSRHMILEAKKDFHRDLNKALKKYDGEIIDDAIETGVSDNVTTIDELILHRVRDLNLVMRVNRTGSNNEVLEGAKGVISNCEVVIVKTPFYKFQGKGQADFYDIVDFMHKEGFVVFDMIEGLFKPSNRALGIIELAFVKEKGPMRPNHKW